MTTPDTINAVAAEDCPQCTGDGTDGVEPWVNDAVMAEVRAKYPVLNRILGNVMYDGKQLQHEASMAFREIRRLRAGWLRTAEDRAVPVEAIETLVEIAWSAAGSNRGYEAMTEVRDWLRARRVAAVTADGLKPGSLTDPADPPEAQP